MSTTTEETGNYQPPTVPAEGDDGFVAPGTTHEDEIAAKDPNYQSEPTPRANASDLRKVMASTCDTVAGWCDYNRDLFAKETVAYGRKQWPEYNWIICHPAHSYIWDGVQGQTWDHWHYELDVYGAGTIGYELYWTKGGFFSLNGDGGFINWAYNGNVIKLDVAPQAPWPGSAQVGVPAIEIFSACDVPVMIIYLG
ncbi:hypothetical protein NMY22_g5876 [Coprinellus aureogranulatus]|nr:hypothetical protein NMY22_g5876 [Coprinellus aureogranulatus]